MKIPKTLNVSTSDLLHVQSKFLLMVAKYGCGMIDEVMDNMLLRAYKQNNRHAGNFLINKVCEEFQVTKYELFESSSRKGAMDARKVYCAIAYEVFDLTQPEISKGFGTHRNMVYRAIKEISEIASETNPLPYQKELLKKYHRVLFKIKAYLNFKAKGTSEENGIIENE